MACSVCFNLQPPHLDGLKKGQRATQFIVFRDLLDSASTTGCAECRFLSNAVTTFRPDTAQVQDGSVIELTLAIGSPLQLYYKQASLNLELFRDVKDLARGVIPRTIGPATVVSRDSGSTECIGKIQTWMSDCEAHHSSCKKQAQDNFLPTRTLKLSPHDPNTISLVHTSGSKGRYIALSYCWGDPISHPSLTTTISTIAAHESGITTSLLPQTLQDAVHLTRSLGFNYLWIDALCIIQDSASDWLREASKMNSVYSQASLTLVASRSPGSHDGIFGTQTFSFSQPMAYEHSQTGESCTLFVRPEQTREHIDFTGLQREPFSFEPINKRAWTLQEALLSPRAVVFATEELRWWCGDGARCECGVLGERMNGSEAMNGAEDLRRIFRRGDAGNGVSREEAYRLWDEVVMLFAQRSLTVEGDRLPALAGLAKEFARLPGGERDEYLAGVWKDSLPKTLLWHVAAYAQRDAGIQRRRPQEWRAPSWSWAAVEACVEMPLYLGMRWVAEVVDVEVVPRVTAAGGLGDGFMAVESGRLVLRAPLIEDLAVEHHPEQHGVVRTLGLKGVPLCGFISDDQYLGKDDDSILEDGGLCALVIGHSKVGRQYSLLVLTADANGTHRRVGVAVQGVFLTNNQSRILDTSAAEPYYPYMSTSPEPIEKAPWKQVTIV